MTDRSTGFVETRLSNGESIYVEVVKLGDDESFVYSKLSIPSFQGFTDGVEAVAQEMVYILEKAKPSSANIELNFEIGISQGDLKALLVRGAGTTNVRITLDYGSNRE